MANIFVNIGSIYGRLGDLGKAIDYYSKSLVLHRKYLDNYYVQKYHERPKNSIYPGVVGRRGCGYGGAGARVTAITDSAFKPL